MKNKIIPTTFKINATNRMSAMKFAAMIKKNKKKVITLANKKYFFQNVFEVFFSYSGADLCPKQDIAFSFSLN